MAARRRDADTWIRLFNRLEAVVTHHKRATAGFATDADEMLYAARARILRDATKDPERRAVLAEGDPGFDQVQRWPDDHRSNDAGVG